jgi:hypothetical protein
VQDSLARASQGPASGETPDLGIPLGPGPRVLCGACGPRFRGSVDIQSTLFGYPESWLASMRATNRAHGDLPAFLHTVAPRPGLPHGPRSVRASLVGRRKWCILIRLRRDLDMICIAVRSACNGATHHVRRWPFWPARGHYICKF